MSTITGFDSLLRTAREQSEPQRLLFVFVKTALPEDASAAEVRRYHEGRGGGLMPVMYVDKSPDEIDGFDTLRAESGQMDADWHMVVVAALAGRAGQAPSEPDVAEACNSIIRTIHAGGDLSHLLVFDRAGDPIHFV